MNTNYDMATVLSPTPNPVDWVSSYIRTSPGLPNLEDLARCFLAAWAPVAGVRAVAVGTDPAGTVPFDAGPTGRKEAWLVTRGRESGSWINMAGRWPQISAVWVDSEEPEIQVFQGKGELPGGAPWSLDGQDFTPVKCEGWMVAPIRIGSHCELALALGLEGEPGSHPEIREALIRFTDVVLPVAAVWTGALELENRLRRVDEENRSLVRLNRLQGHFVAMASHEFKAPLTSITAYTDVLNEKLKESEFPHAQEFLDVIGNEADRLLRMVNRILDFTRLEHGSHLLALKPVDMEPMVREAVRSLNTIIKQKNLTLEVDAPAGLPRVAVDPDLIRQVLINLLHNAVKFTPAQGRITVRVQEEESALAVSVMDDGPGIPPEDIRRIFREFYRAEGGTSGEGGSGLGLTIARHIVNLHGGHIEVARRPEGGSDFRFLVPKEMGALAPLAEVMRQPVDREEGARLVENLLFLLAEMTGSRTVVMLLRDGRGALVPVGALGLDLETTRPLPLIENPEWTRFLERGEAVTDPGLLARDLSWCPREKSSHGCRMYAPIGDGESALGLVIMGRRRGLESYAQADLVQLSILTDIIKASLAMVNKDLAPVTGVLRLLLRIRRNGVPTATAPALTLMGKLGTRLNLSRRETRRLQLAAVLHDAGMAQVEEEIVLGESDLSLDERDEVNRHVEQVVDLLGPLLQDDSVARIIRHHHERFDGNGYPEGLKGEEIPLSSRVIAVIDTWFSLTSPRPFRSGLSPEEAHAEILAHQDTQFDGRVVKEFTRLLKNEGMLEPGSPEPGPACAPPEEKE